MAHMNILLSDAVDTTARTREMITVTQWQTRLSFNLDLAAWSHCFVTHSVPHSREYCYEGMAGVLIFEMRSCGSMVPHI
jgi:hypothetical protein